MAKDSFDKELDRILTLTPDKQKTFHPVKSRSGAAIEVKGKAAVDFTSRDYLGVLSSKKVKRAVQEEIEKGSVGSIAPRLSTGTTPLHLQCEDRIARFVGAERSLLFSSRNQAVLSLITSCVGEQDVVIASELTQSPVFDAAYLVGARTVSYNPETLKELSEELSSPPLSGRRFLFIESLSPVTAEVSDLIRLFNLAREGGAEVIVDESYALPALGIRGAGGVEFFKAVEKPLAIFSEFGLGLGVFGSFVAGSKNLSRLLLQRSRTFQAETPLPSASAVAIISAIDEIELKTAEREKIRMLASRLRSGSAECGYLTCSDSASPIVSLHFDKMNKAIEVSEALFNRGFLLEAQSLGRVRSEAAVVRAFLSVEHSEAQVDKLLQGLTEILPRLQD